MSDDIIHATGDLFPMVAGVATSKGVAMNPPPETILGQVSRMVTEAVKAIPEGSRTAVVGIATEKHGEVNVNLAIASRVGDQVTIVGWLGKSWGAPVEKGVAVQWHF